jgi:hypothetical protein
VFRRTGRASHEIQPDGVAAAPGGGQSRSQGRRFSCTARHELHKCVWRRLHQGHPLFRPRLMVIGQLPSVLVTVQFGQYPAKWTDNPFAPVTLANCTSDYVVFGLNVVGRRHRPI